MTSFSKLSKDQIETLSEIVFGLSITFSAIQFAFSPPVYAGDILMLIGEFAVSFTILIWVWITYLRIARNLGGQRAPSLFLNVVLLLLATVEPYLLYTVWVKSFVATSSGTVLELATQVAFVAWALDVALMLTILAIMAIQGVEARGARASDALRRATWRYAKWFWGCAIALVVTVTPPFWIRVYSGTVGGAPVAVINPIIYLPLLLWPAVFAFLGYGSIRFGGEIDRELEAATRPPGHHAAAEAPAPSE